jgi:tRNA pseudouridine38-40 synthase
LSEATGAPGAPAAPRRAYARTLALVVAYDGTDFHGWQAQPVLPTVQATLLACAREVLGDAVRVTGASRTDAGVHALGQAVSLSTDAVLPPAAVQAALNATLPATVRVRAACEAAPAFDARRQAAGKRYAYLIDNAPVASPLLARYAWHLPRPLDLDAMRSALAPLRGRHDFGAFCAAAGRGADPRCHVRALHVVRRRERVAVLISADRFLHHMVRIVVGSAVSVGRGARDPAWLASVLASRDRRRAGPTAPAHALTLLRVLFPRAGVGRPAPPALR